MVAGGVRIVGDESRQAGLAEKGSSVSFTSFGQFDLGI